MLSGKNSMKALISGERCRPGRYTAEIGPPSAESPSKMGFRSQPNQGFVSACLALTTAPSRPAGIVGTETFAHDVG